MVQPMIRSRMLRRGEDLGQGQAEVKDHRRADVLLPVQSCPTVDGPAVASVARQAHLARPRKTMSPSRHSLHSMNMLRADQQRLLGAVQTRA